jgi:predicted TIM-barrel fold metal-dependent hydrolase
MDLDNSLPLQARLRHCAECAPEKAPSRRGFLLGALGSAALAACSTPMGGGAGVAAMDLNVRTARRIDVHHHVSPPAWIEVARSRGLDGLAAVWTVEKTLADMDRAGIATSVLSVTSPGVVFADLDRAAGRRLARDCNEWQAQLVRSHPGRFGFFATLPMNDAEGALAEIAHAMDVLKADGIGLMTSYGDKWLGDPVYFPIMEELNRRKVVVYTHPTAANCCGKLQANIQPVMIEFGTDTTRTIASILFNGNARRFRDIRWIFSHAGGTMPFLYERFVRNPILVPSAAPLFPQGVLPELQRFHYDTAQASNGPALAALTKMVPTSQILFGTDFPYRTSYDHVKQIRDVNMFDAATLAVIERQNALRLMPRLPA